MTRSYQNELTRLIDRAEQIPNTRMMALAKITSQIVMNMRYEREVMLNRDLATHPWDYTAGIVRDAGHLLENMTAIAFIEAKFEVLHRKGDTKDAQHHDLFQSLWVKFSETDYEDRIDRYRHRLQINGLNGEWLRGKRCADFGCGHGNFAHALIREGAAHACGIDFGEDSIRYAQAARDRLKQTPEKLEFRHASVYEAPFPDESFDFVIQNGVFHHLDNEPGAYREAIRVLKKGGWFWIYTDGAGGISHDLWDASVKILRDVPRELILEHLQYLNLEVGKRYHLGDGLQAVYRHETYEGITRMLSEMGMGNFRRLVGGFPTDFDHDVIAADKYGKEKFGDGDLRILAQKL